MIALERFAAGLKALQNGGDFADPFIVETAREHGCAHLATFDESLAAAHPNFVVRPK